MNTVPASSARMAASLRVVQIVVALVVLNGLLSFQNLWPTLWIQPDWRLAPEFVLVWFVAMLLAFLQVRPGPRLITGFTLLYLAFMLARYWDVTIPALFGRPLNLYWDGRELPRLVEWLFPTMSWPRLMLFAAVLLVGLWVLLVVVRGLIRIAFLQAAPRAVESVPAVLLTAFGVALVVANVNGVRATWPYVSKPVLPSYVQQASLVFTALSPGRLDAALPPSPPMTGDLAVLEGRDVDIVFLESYGASTWDDAAIRRAVTASRDRFGATARAAGLRVVSANVRSPTFAGGSGLAHMSFLTGINTQNASHYELLLTSQRPTLVRHFAAHGYRTTGVGIYSGERPEHAFYGFENLLNADDFDYRGQPFGPWKIPDQFAFSQVLAELNNQRTHGRDLRPQLLFFPTLASHLPFGPLPPVQTDSPQPLRVNTAVNPDDDQVPGPVSDWSNLAPAYAASINYSFDWLALTLNRPRDRVLILIGDHQPAASVVGANASWDVPVHVIARDDAVLARLLEAGFSEGMTPRRSPLGPMHVLTPLLLDAFSTPSL